MEEIVCHFMMTCPQNISLPPLGGRLEGGIYLIKFTIFAFQNNSMDRFSEIIAKRTGLSVGNVANTIKLFDEGATIPFISRYRKEMTGSMDELQVGEVKEQLTLIRELEKRKETVLKAIDDQEKLTPELKKKIEECDNLTDLEDIYLPYKIKKKTRATKAREAGLEPLAVIMMKQKEVNIEGKAAEFINDDITDVDAALAGARDIIAEWVSENKRARNSLRSLFERTAVIYSSIIKGKAADAEKYQDYFEFSEPLKKCPSHRMLAIRRAEGEGFLKISIQVR